MKSRDHRGVLRQHEGSRADSLVGRGRGKGFRYILAGMNAERILIASEECIGDAKVVQSRRRRALRKKARAVQPADRPEPGRAVFRSRRAYMQMARCRADGARRRRGFMRPGRGLRRARPIWRKPSLPPRPPWAAGRHVPTDPRRLFGFAEEFRHRAQVPRDRGFTRVAARISTNMVLSYIAEHVLGLPRSY